MKFNFIAFILKAHAFFSFTLSHSRRYRQCPRVSFDAWPYVYAFNFTNVLIFNSRLIFMISCCHSSMHHHSAVRALMYFDVYIDLPSN